jgi:iron complex outermembrane receptor protein
VVYTIAPCLIHCPTVAFKNKDACTMQRVRSTPGKKPLTQFVLATLCAAGTQISHGQTTGDLGSVQSTAVSSSDNSAPAAKNTQSAPAQAPSQGSLTASEPKSVISQRYIRDTAPPRKIIARSSK